MPFRRTYRSLKRQSKILSSFPTAGIEFYRVQGHISRQGLRFSEEDRADYIKVQIQGALKKAFGHGRDGLTETDEPRAVR